MSAKGGITEGKSHKEGGIPMEVKSTGQKVELEGGEGVINKRNMASEKTFEFEGKEKTICEIASEINSADGNGVKIDCDNVTGKKYEYATGGKILDEESEANFKEWMDDGNVYEVEDGIYTTQDAQWTNRVKGMDELRRYYAKEFLSDKYEGGGKIPNVDHNDTYGKEFTYDGGKFLIVDFPNFKGSYISKKGANWRKNAKHHSYIIKLDDKETILDKSLFKTFQKPYYVYDEYWEKFEGKPSREVEGNSSKLINQIMYESSSRNKYEGGGSVEDYKSLIGKYVNIYSMGVSLPTENQIKDVMVSGEQFRHRDITLKFDIGNAKIPLNEADAFMQNEIIFVKDSKEEFGIQLIPNQYAKGGRMPNSLKIEDYETASMSAGGYEEQMIVPQDVTGIYENGGNIREMSWYKDFKKDQLKKGTEHEMEHIDTIREFKKEGVSDREVAQAIAKDHLDEDENYYEELEKMESSRKLSEAIKDFEKHKGYRRNSPKFKHGGYMGENDSKEIVHITFNSDVDAVIRDKQGKYIGESKFAKETIHKFTFKHNDGRNSTLELLKGAFIVVPNEKINIVGFNEEKFGNGGNVKAYQSIPFSENDKKIAKMLTQFTNPTSYNSRQRQKLSTFRGNNVVNELASGLIQKIYGLLFEYHNIENPIRNLYLSNVGAGNIVSYAPKYIDKLMIDFDEKNRFVEIEKEINAIINVDKKYTLSNPLDLRYMDAFIHVYSKTNPDKEELNYLFLQSEKSAVALGVCEFTSRERLDKFQRQIVENQGGFSQNQMVQYKNTNKYLIVNEGITDEGQYTLIYVMTKF
jgi:hypothetical protein